jgi:PPOX class probable F420-dependent enzyme
MALLDARVRGFLERQRVAHLATASADGEPHVVPICFCLSARGEAEAPAALYVAIDEKPKTSDVSRLRRLRNIAANPSVAVVADVYDDADWSRLGFVLVHGVARVLGPELAEHQRAVAGLRARYAQYRAMALTERPVIAIDVLRVTVWGVLE